jgi:hypothetical protein
MIENSRGVKVWCLARNDRAEVELVVEYVGMTAEAVLMCKLRSRELTLYGFKTACVFTRLLPERPCVGG